jgi:hypothetical protein
VEYFDSDGAGYITIFAGQSAEVRARDYYDAIEHGALNTRIADAQVVTAKREGRRLRFGRAGLPSQRKTFPSSKTG